jgi:UDPglucose 6-dehydrogenase
VADLSKPETIQGGAAVAVVGAGYVGLTTAVCLAHFGHTVCCGERDPSKFDLLSRGVPTIIEDGLAEFLGNGLDSGRLRFVATAAEAVEGAEFVFLCVPTPERPDGSADITALTSASKEIGPYLASGAVVINKSTVPIGSTLLVEQLLERDDVTVLSNPEFLREGSAIQDTLHPTRIVIGGPDQEAASKVANLLASSNAPVVITNAATAELIKYASNAFLATKLSFVNAAANLCEALGANVEDMLLGMGYDGRIGFDYLTPGPGWGGSCLPKDTRALAFMAREAGVSFSLLEEAIRSNESQIDSIVEKVRRSVGGLFSGVLVGALGLTFKSGTDDRRNSPAIEVLRRIVAQGARVQAYDPTVSGVAIPELSSVVLFDDPYSASRGADALVVLTEWDEFRSLDLDKLRSVMGNPRIVDARNVVDGTRARALGFSYVGIGRP